jgi:rubrerythrin
MSRSPKCEICGYDRSGLPAGAVCPECGDISAARKVSSFSDQECWSCGYDRSGLPKDSVCPECGRPAQRPNLERSDALPLRFWTILFVAIAIFMGPCLVSGVVSMVFRK